MYDNHSIVPKCDEVNFTVFKFVQTIEFNVSLPLVIIHC